MSHSGAASFKKVAGIITINEDVSPVELSWRSTTGDKHHVIKLDTIDKLQATPATSDKMMLRLIERVDETKKQKDNEGNEVVPKPQSHMFSFNNREVMDNIKITLQQVISRYKDTELYEEKRKSEEQPLVRAPLINTATLDDSLSREKLLVNFKLQQSLLRNNKPLMRTFQETVMEAGLPPEVFWSTRVSLLRAFALSTSQKVGPYNVLSTIRPVASSENKVNVNLSREKIYSIFENYPIVKKAYDDNVPKNFKEQEFWARFFSSKLFRKLRGEKSGHHDRGDVIIDRYLSLDQEYDRMDDEKLTHAVNKYIDVDGNMEDDPVRFGNRPDFTMQPGRDVNGNSDGTIDILKGMNRLSEKMVMALENEYSRANIRKEDPDEKEREYVEITDLENTYKAEYAMVHLKNKGIYGNENGLNHVDGDSEPPVGSEDATGDSSVQIQKYLTEVIDRLTGKLNLTNVLPDKEVSGEVNKNVMSAVRTNAKQAKHNRLDSTLGSFAGSKIDEPEAKTELLPDLLESCRMLHATCCEFLKHFYIHFQSGDNKQAITVNKLYKHLKSCVTKLNALFKDVKKGEGEDIAHICMEYLKPVLNSVTLAIEKYDKAFTEYNRDILAQ